MLKKTILFLLSFAVLCTVLLGAVFLEKKSLKREVEKYLLERGYLSTEIHSIEVYLGKPLFSARVIFNDEKDVTYYYLKEKKNIRQFGTPTGLTKNNKSFKHQEDYFQ